MRSAQPPESLGELPVQLADDYFGFVLPSLKWERANELVRCAIRYVDASTTVLHLLANGPSCHLSGRV